MATVNRKISQNHQECILNVNGRICRKKALSEVKTGSSWAGRCKDHRGIIRIEMGLVRDSKQVEIG